MTDRELKECVSASQKEGFKALFQQYKSYVYAIVWNQIRRTGTAEDAEECLSDVFLQVFLHFDEIEEGSLQAYIGTVARRKAIDYARKLQAVHDRTRACDDFTLLPSDENVEQDMQDAMEHRLLLETIQALGEPDTSILILRYFYCRKYRDIAEQLHMTPVAVRVRLNRALKKLRQRLRDEQPDMK